MPPILPRTAVALVLAGLSFSVLAQCNFLPAKPKPSWVDKDPIKSDEYLYAVGVVGARKGEADDLLKQAKQNGLTELAEGIQVHIKSHVTQVSSRTEKGGKRSTAVDFQALAETSAGITLRSVETDDQWLDRSSCLLWVRVRVKKSLAEQAAAEAYYQAILQQVDSLIARASDAKLDASARSSVAEEARILIDQIDFTAVSKATPKQLYIARLDNALSAARKDTLSKGDVERALRSAAEHADRAKNAAEPFDRAQAYGEAVRTLRSILISLPDGVPGTISREDLLSRVADAEQARGNSCEARAMLSAIPTQSLTDQTIVREKIERRLKEATCTQDDVKRWRWASVFGGKRAALICFHHVAKADLTSEWRKACDAVNGAIVRAGGKAATWSAFDKASLATIEKSLPKANPQPDYVVVLGAEGAMNERSATNASGKEYQYAGKLGAMIIKEGSAILSDVFDGITGWNPISAQMTMDVLALNLVKRLDERLSALAPEQVNTANP